jgi:uncharacterized membrane protein YqaE (UPF0057 family)
MHAISLLFGSLAIVSTKRNFFKYDILKSIIFIGVYFGYVVGMVHAFNVTSNATGVIPYD